MSQNKLPLHKFPSSWPAQSPSWAQAQVLVPLPQLPLLQASPVVHGLPSLQLAVLLAWLQPLLGTQPSVVHGLPSSHRVLGLTEVPLQLLLPHTSLTVQAFPSLQDTVLALLTQPLLGLQLSLVHTLLSLQDTAVPLQLPPPQASFWLQALPSSQGKVVAVKVHVPVLVLQASEVQELLSLQTVAEPGLQAELAHTSPTVHALPSVHGRVLGVLAQPVLASQLSLVQGLLSLQLTEAPAVHTPELQASLALHTEPSASQAPFSFCETYPHLPALVSQEFLLQAVSLLASQLTTVLGLTTHL